MAKKPFFNSPRHYSQKPGGSLSNRRDATSPASEKARLPLGALMLAASVSCWAQSGASQETTLETVHVREKLEEAQGKDALQTRKTTIGKGTQDIRDIPQSISVITEKLIDDVKLDTLKEALHYSAGITFSATENGTDQDIRLRGFPVATTGDLLRQALGELLGGERVRSPLHLPLSAGRLHARLKAAGAISGESIDEHGWQLHIDAPRSVIAPLGGGDPAEAKLLQELLAVAE